ncbi:Rrf2 family transcriptional regulator [Rhodococcus sp. 06-462-5]|uniref:RrF2 family transcriptional regulator n=1 Tax=Nocardiaceae TaxID=85025 RepID=UPI00050C3D63|nr:MULTISPECIES: Rrf2 family transcriptional regulator [Rhodococcus]OZC73961.1 Rrf2 family transcriptional regulator [Rhodococcus sp. 06-462-5]OZE67957.1 Rrf2 family transcriptional regulator [Rhodococcus sp. 02-925g]OZF52022.1 Rrf2 family transcriptional regulator [Rhodococcus sp. 14-1411-2a]
MPAPSTQFSIAVHVLAALAHYEGYFTSEHLAGSVNANPIFVKKILVKLSKANLVDSAVGKSGGYALARSAESISLFDIFSAVDPPSASAVHTYPVNADCVISSNIQEVMADVLTDIQVAVEKQLRGTTLANVVSRIKAKVEAPFDQN